MKIKTLEDLNEKVWYRLLKVLFILLFVFVFGVYNYLVFSEGTKEIDETKTVINCNLKDKKSFTAEEAGLYLDYDTQGFKNGNFNYEEYFRGYNEYQILKILGKCYGDTGVTLLTDAYDQQKVYEIVNKFGLIGEPEATPEQIAAMEAENAIYKSKTQWVVGSSKANYLDFSIEAFDIKPVFDQGGFFKALIIGNAIIVLIFEAIRRIFYYIVLGSITPKRTGKKELKD